MPSRPVVLLGASNLRLGLSTLLRQLVNAFDDPLEAYVGCGFGRSYGLWTWIPFRGLPGLAECGLWDAVESTDRNLPDPTINRDPLRSGFTVPPVEFDQLPHKDGTEGLAAKEPAPRLMVADGERESQTAFVPAAEPIPRLRPLALITDVGNDLTFGVPVAQIVEWVERCVVRLTARNASVVITLPPVARLLQLSAAHYYAARTLFFPSSRLTRARMGEQVEALSGELRSLASRHGARVVSPRREWYGLDPIHIRRSRRSSAWLEICRAWPEFDAAYEARRTAGRVGRIVRPPIWRLRPHRRRALLGEQFRRQPSFESEALSVLLY